MLLSGEPGVGKTLTAESVAEEMHQPLYSMSAGELGETAAEVEDALDLVLEIATKWNAVLLLDECDMFLEARTTADIRHNRLISGKLPSALFDCCAYQSSLLEEVGVLPRSYVPHFQSQ